MGDFNPLGALLGGSNPLKGGGQNQPQVIMMPPPAAAAPVEPAAQEKMQTEVKPTPNQTDKNVQQARANAGKAGNQNSRLATLLSSPQGITGEAEGKKKTLLGQ